MSYLPAHLSRIFSQEPLKAGDLVKIELGCHVDYYSAVVAHTVKVDTSGHTPTYPEQFVLQAKISVK